MRDQTANFFKKIRSLRSFLSSATSEAYVTPEISTQKQKPMIDPPKIQNQDFNHISEQNPMTKHTSCKIKATETNEKHRRTARKCNQKRKKCRPNLNDFSTDLSLNGKGKMKYITFGALKDKTTR